MGEKANHHYIPQLYLREFSDGIGRRARVFTFDAEEKRTFPTRVRNVGSQRYFNRVDAEFQDPNTLEDALSKMEGEIAPHLAEVIAARDFPSPDHYVSVLTLIANVSVRNPRLRGVLTKFHQDVAEKMLGLVLASKGNWQSLTDEMRDAGVPLRADITYEEMKAFQEKKKYNILIDQTHLINMELQMLEPVFATLAKRNWCFVEAKEGQFITSDDPAVLTNRPDNPMAGGPVGHGMGGTMLFFPLSSELSLIGTFESLPERMEYSSDQVRSANSLIANYSTRQIYARDGNFEIILKDGTVCAGRDLPQKF